MDKESELQELLIECHFDYMTKWGELYFYEENSPSMNDAINFVKRVMPNVRTIFCYVSHLPDVAYHRNRDGEWVVKQFAESQDA